MLECNQDQRTFNEKDVNRNTVLFCTGSTERKHTQTHSSSSHSCDSFSLLIFRIKKCCYVTIICINNILFPKHLKKNKLKTSKQTKPLKGVSIETVENQVAYCLSEVSRALAVGYSLLSIIYIYSTAFNSIRHNCICI